MIDLHSLQQRLNKDETLREEFLADPVSVLAKEGLRIPEGRERSLRELTAKARNNVEPVGSSVGRDNSIEIDITIPI